MGQVAAAGASVTDVPVDPGCLPAWEVGELPRPVPFRMRNWLSLIGPGLVLAGASVGSGEFVIGPQVGARYHGAMMWAVLASIVAQVILNTEVMRYTLCTGEPIFTGFMRSWPGPKFWIVIYLLLDFGGWWPAQAGLAAQILVVMCQGLSPTDTIDLQTVRMVSYGVFAVCGAAALFGGKIYNTVAMVASGKFLSVLLFMAFCSLFYVSAKTWGQMWAGLINPFNVPQGVDGRSGIDWTIIASLVGLSGVGGMGNIMVSNFVREKGWGMGPQVGAIPSAFGGHKITLSHIGTMCRPGPETTQRFRGWFRYLLADQYAVWALGSLIAMMMPCMLGAEYLKGQGFKDQWRWAAALAQDFGSARGEIFRFLTLLSGLIIMIPGQFMTIDTTSRRWTDAIWSASRWVRTMDTHKVKYIYYSLAGAYLTFGLCGYTFFPNLSASTMMLVAANTANLSISACIFHTLYVNHRFLPKELRPSMGKSAALATSGLFFLAMFALVVNQKIVPMLLGK